VLDFGQYLAAPLVAMMLADLGAEVTRIDPPGGPQWKHDANALLQRGKRSVTLDLKNSSERSLAQRLIDRSDIVLEGFRPGVMRRLGVGPQESTQRNPRLIYVSIPGFGHDDPRADLPAWEGVVNAAAGVFATVPDQPNPPFNALPLASSYAAMVAAHSVMAALIARERDGRGQWVEVPLFDAAFEAIGQVGQYTPVAESIPYRPTRPMPPPLGHYRCADGRWLHLCLIQDRHLKWFGQKFMPPEWIADGMVDADRLWTDPELSARARQRFADMFKTRTAIEWEQAINNESGAPSALCSTSEQWLCEDTHARAIGAVVGVDDPELGPTAQAGWPAILSATPARVSFARHQPDQDRATILSELEAEDERGAPRSSAPPPPLSQALSGIRVVDLTQVLAGPTTTRVLAEYGAEVIKVQNPADQQLRYHFYGNSGKRTIILDLRSEAGRDVINGLVDGVDVFVENFADGVAERLGVAEDDVRDRSPQVIYASISAFGKTGYRGGWRGREELGQAITGMQMRWGGFGPDDEPLQGPLTFTDSGAGLCGAFGIMVGLFHRLRSGLGQRVESSLAHAGTYLQIPYMLAYPRRRWTEPNGLDATGWNAFDRIYATADGWLYLAAVGSADRERLGVVEGLDHIDFGDDSNVEQQLTERLVTQPAAVWEQRLHSKELAAHRVLTPEQVMEDPIAKARGLSVIRQHPGIGPIRNPGPTGRLARTPARLTTPASAPGSDSRAVLEEYGFADRADELIANSVVRVGLPDEIELFGRPR
jgi:crotonobetainyl-CoA:carnitine CoA-transferase CaiB-like acyl-CoA transferase